MAAVMSCENSLYPGQVVVLMPPQALLHTTMFTDDLIVLKIAIRVVKTLFRNIDTVTFYLEKLYYKVQVYGLQIK